MALRKKTKVYLPDRVYLGVITKPHGLKGEVKMKLFGCEPDFLQEFDELNIEEQNHALVLEQLRGSDKSPIFKFKGINTREQAEALIGMELWVHESEMPDLDENVYYESDFLYAQAQTPDGTRLGRIVEVIETGESDVLVIRDGQGNELLLPAIKDVVLKVHKDEGLVIVEPLAE